MFKKISDYLNLVCCARDNEIRRLIFELAKTYTHLQHKKDKTIMLDHLFSIFAVQFQANLSIRYEEESFIEILTNEKRVSKIDSAILTSFIQKY